MSLRLLSFGLISAVVLMSGLPASANDDAADAVIQSNVQEGVVTGNRNNSVNASEQTSDTDSRRRAGNTGTSQRNAQMNDVQGNDNNAVNVNVQKSKHKRR